MVKFPELKKKISSFLRKEDGKISKENLIKAGVIVAASALLAKDVVAGHSSCPVLTQLKPVDTESHNQANIIKHSNTLSIGTTASDISATHNHAIDNCHSNHSSHTSHCNAGTGKW